MRYLLAIIFPPLAVAASAGFLATMLNLFLCLLFWVPGMLHACLVVSRYYADQRHDELIRAVKWRPGDVEPEPWTFSATAGAVTGLVIIAAGAGFWYWLVVTFGVHS